MRIVLRCDDIGSGSNHDFLRIEERLFELCFELGLPMTIGVVPLMSRDVHNPGNQRFASLADDGRRMAMVRRGIDHGFQVALHGLHHQVARAGTKSEFAGRPHQDQVAVMEEGLGHLRAWFPDADVDILIPPWNTYDADTLAAASSCGLRHVSAGDNSPTIDVSGVTVSSSVPVDGFFGLLEFNTPDQLARQIGDGHLVVTFHAYEFLDSHPNHVMSLETFGQRLQELSAGDVTFVTIDPGLSAADFKPDANRRLNLRVAVILKSSRLGRFSVVDLARTIRRRFGTAPARWLVDAGAVALFWLPILRRAKRGF